MYPGSSVITLFLLFWCFTLACISFGILVSAFFSRARTAGIVGLAIYFVQINVYAAVETTPRLYSIIVKKVSMLLFPCALCWGLQTALGLQTWGYLASGDVDHVHDVSLPNIRQKYMGVSVGDACGFLILDTVLYFVLGWYFHQLLPGLLRIPYDFKY